ncbi:MAG: HAD-IA family hydrolase [Succinivibrionaceae bacterium]|nr:HAD-IA family hydrolase [Succinivibrionaceae bacterium]
MVIHKSLNRVRAITFDLDDTLYDNQGHLRRSEEEFAALLGRRFALMPGQCRPQWWAAERERVLALNPSLADDVTALRERTVLEGLAALGRPLPGGAAQARELVGLFVERRSQVAVPASSVELLRRLARRLPLAAVSNGNARLSGLGLQGLFALDLRPAVGGPRRKPFPDLFLEAARRLGVAPGEILHVGDDPITDVEGAVGAGCQCAHLEGGITGRLRPPRAACRVPTVTLGALAEVEELV